MMLTIKKSFLLLVIFLIIPIVITITHWQWSPESLNSFSWPLYWLTETGSAPWAAITCFLFWLLFMFCLKTKTKQQAFKLLLILFFAVVFGQVIKSGVKNYTSEPRPYVQWMQTEYGLTTDYFYSVPRAEREALITQNVNHSPIIPQWLAGHWRHETGYSFPSGHMMFAATWAFLALLLLDFRKNKTVVCGMITWAVLMQVSRLMLGMHHVIDVVAGSILAWLVVLITYYLAKKWRFI